MSETAYIVGTHCTAFGRRPHDSYKTLVRETYTGVLADAGLVDGSAIDAAWFGSCLMHLWDQPALRGNVAFIPLVREGLFPGRAPIINVEGGCATGTLALAGAIKEIRAGDADLALAIGADKLYDPVDPARMLAGLGQGMDRMDPDEWIQHYTEVGARLDKPFQMSADRSIAMDTYAMQALLHMQLYGTTVEQIAIACAKNHNAGALNPKAQYRFTTTPGAVLADRPITDPLTRAMCAPMGDGAAAALVCSERWLRQQPLAVQRRAVAVRGIGLSGGKYRALDEPSLTRAAADKAYAMAGLGPQDIQLAEVHDATSFCEIYQCEMLRLCGTGEGGPFVASGATTLGGRVPVNTSGGLVSKGHPVGATGLSMCSELVTQLRGEAGARQVPGARIALQENGGGIMGLEEAVAGVVVYEAAS